MKKTILALLLTGGAAFGSPLVYNVSVLTNLSGLGSLDFQYNPGPTATQTSTATVSGFTPTTGLNSPDPFPASVTGSLLTSLAIVNAVGTNEYFIHYTFPATILFTLTLSGPGVDTPSGTGSGSTFAFSLYDNAGTTPLKSTNGGGYLFTIDLSNLGGVTTATFATGGAQVVIRALPEPGTIALFPVALGAIALLRRKRA